METSRPLQNPAEKEPDPPPELIGESEHIKNLHDQIKAAAGNDSTVLIEGPTGSGKEVVAKRIHFLSGRKEKNFIIVNCAAIPETLLESELFGHERGSFTGALTRRIGKFEQCPGGTIFLDEIGDMPPTTQAKVLRVLQDKKITRVGGNQEIQVDLRIISATNKDLREEIKRDHFRADLRSRLSQFVIYTKPLKDRVEDLVLLIHNLIDLKRSSGRTEDKQFKIEPRKKFLLYAFDYPEGNVRELGNLFDKDHANIKREMLLSWAGSNGVDKEKIVNVRSYSDNYLQKILRDIGYSRVRASLKEDSQNDPIAPLSNKELRERNFERAKREAEKVSQIKAIFYPDLHGEDCEKIVGAYEIALLTICTELSQAEIKRRLHIGHVEKTFEEEFKRRFGLELPQKGNEDLDMRPLKIYPTFTTYWNWKTGKDYHNQFPLEKIF